MASVGIEQTIVGNVGNVYELRRVGQDKRAVIDFSVAVTPRSYNPDSKEWQDGETTWVNCTAWDRLAENIEKSFGKGKSTRVIVKGKVRTKPEFTKDDGTVVPPRDYLNVEFAGPEIFFDPALPVKGERSNSGSNSSNDSSSRSTAKREAPKKEAAKKEAPAKEENLDDLDDLDFDLDTEVPW